MKPLSSYQSELLEKTQCASDAFLHEETDSERTSGSNL